MRLLSKLLVLLVLLTLGSISAQAQNTCTYFGGYPWRKGGCLIADDLNTAMAQALGPPSTLSTTVVQAALTPGGVTLGMLSFTPLIAGNNLSDLSSITAARTTLGLGGMALQNPNAVAITGGTITGLGTPTVSADAATKGYVDASATGLQPNPLGADYATATVLPNSPTYSNGASGVGATLTANVSNSALVVDGQVVSTVGKRVLVKNQAAPAQNGPYQLSQAADATHPWILTRVTDFDQPVEMAVNTYFFVAAGTGGTNAATGWTSGTRPTTIGTDPITFSQFSAAQTYSASGGVQLIGNTFSLVNQSMTLAGHIVSLGGTQTFSASDLTDGVSGTGAIAKVASPAFTTPSLGAATGTSVVLTGAFTAGGVSAVNSGATWLETYIPASSSLAQLRSISTAVTPTVGGIGVLGAARTSDFSTAGINVYGLAGFAINDHASQADIAWGGLFLAARRTAAVGATLGIEVEATNTVNGIVDVAPFAMFPGTGLTGGVWIAPSPCSFPAGSGICAAPTFNTSAAIGIVGNGAVLLNGNTHTTTTIDGISSTANIVVGGPINGPCLASGTTVVSKAANSVVISNAATCTATITFNYSSVFRLGIVFDGWGLDPFLGAGGAGVAIEMAMKQSVRWMDGSNTSLVEMFADANGRLNITGGKLTLVSMITSCSGQITGTFINNAGVVNVCP